MTTLIYDGQCGLCTGSMRLVRRLDWLNRIEYLDAQDWPAVHARYPALAREALLAAIHVVRPDGQVHVGYEGVRALARQLPLFMGVYPLLFLPGIRWLGPRIYNWIAANRYRFNRWLGMPDPCADGTCSVHRGVR